MVFLLIAPGSVVRLQDWLAIEQRTAFTEIVAVSTNLTWTCMALGAFYKANTFVYRLQDILSEYSDTLPSVDYATSLSKSMLIWRCWLYPLGIVIMLVSFALSLQEMMTDAEPYNPVIIVFVIFPLIWIRRIAKAVIALKHNAAYQTEMTHSK